MKIQSHFVDLDTPTGVMRTYIHRPVGEGSYPVILFYSEIFQQTGPIERAARLMASHGYAVLVPEVFHELNPIGTVLGYDDAGRDKGNADKEAKDVQSYDSDNVAMIEFVKTQPWCNGHIGAMGYCQHSMERLDDIKGELLMIWGKQDNHVPADGLLKIYQELKATDITFTWHEFNAEHAFMRDEGDGGRYDAQTAQIGYQLALNLFSRTLR